MKATFLICCALAIVGMAVANAQVTTTPVGYVTITVNANSDTKVGVSMQQASVYSAGVTSVATGTITVPGTVPDVTTNPHYVLVTTPSGSLEGNWYEVTGYTSTTITVAENLQTAGLTSSDTINVIPFWTLDTLFPSGGGIPASSNVSSPVGQLLLNNVNASGINLSSAASYIYHSGEQGPAGWYDLGNIPGGIQGGKVISPESYITIRNQTGSAANVVMSGSVPATPVSNTILSRVAGAQDNQIANPFPAGLQLQDSNLFSGGVLAGTPNVSSPRDQLLVFEGTPTGINPSPTKSIIYHTGEQGPAGYYDLGNIPGGLINTYEIPAGAALILRKVASSDATVDWTPNVPYTP